MVLVVEPVVDLVDGLVLEHEVLPVVPLVEVVMVVVPEVVASTTDPVQQVAADLVSLVDLATAR